jgi:CheY-like chemotaxis protein
MHKLKVLLVEDEMIIARELTYALRLLGHNAVGHARTGEQAIEMAGALQPDLVLMDIHLASAMDGITAAQSIKKQYAVPSLFISAFTSDDSLTRAEACQPAGYLSKPFEEHELRAALEVVMQKK